MRFPALLILAIALAVLMGGTDPSPLQRQDVQRDLAALAKRGFTYRMFDNDIIELTDPLSGEKHLRSLREPSETEIRAWAAQRGIPVLEIDPNTIDTSRYTGWFTYWSEVPLSNDSGEPLVIGDADRNGMADVYGIYLDQGSDFATRIYQVDAKGAVSLRHDFSPRHGVAEAIIDADRDSLSEVILSFGGSNFDFEQLTSTSLPDSLQFVHRTLQSYLDPGYLRPYFGNLDGDRLMDFLYKGSERDSVDTTLARGKIYVAEYESVAANFVRKWSTEYSGEDGLAVDDFDQDGKSEFAVTDFISGRVFVTENTGDNTYDLVWLDSVPFVNVAHLGSGDVDADGKPELFIGASMSDGTWTTAFESDGDDHFSPTLLIHFLSGGTFDSPQYLTRDVDGDGKRELVVCSGRNIYFLKSPSDNHYSVWYLKRENARDGIAFYDFNRDGKTDFIVSKTVYVSPPGYFRFYADIYIGTSLVPVSEERHTEASDVITLYHSFPNPFNPSTTIEYSIPQDGHVSLVVYDVLGRKVAVLESAVRPAGGHRVRFDASNLTSGVYFYRLEANGLTAVKKMMLIK